MKKHIFISIFLFLFSLGAAFGFTYNYKSNNKVVKNENNIVKKEDKKEEKIKEKKDERIPYVLIAGLPQSSKIKSTLIALYDTKNHSLNYFPFNYDIKQGSQDIGLGYLSPEKIMEKFKEHGLKIIDVIPLDNEDVQKLYIEHMNKDGEVYTITFKTKDGKEKKIPIRSWQHLALILTKNYTSNFSNLENLQHKFLLLLKDQDFFNEYMTGAISNEGLYDEKHLYSITGKQFPTEYINSKTLQVDKDYIYLKGLINGDISEYLELLNKRKEEEKKTEEKTSTKKKTLKERLAEMKAKKKKKETLKEKLKRLKEEKKKKQEEKN